MKNEKDSIGQLFENLKGQWDVQEPESSHATRFLEKQAFRKSKRTYWIPVSVAASIIFAIGCFTFSNSSAEAKNLQFASSQTREADSVFTSVIDAELVKLKEKNSPENKIIIADALEQMRLMDADYEKIKIELSKNGESQQIIYAMISNLQTRISFLQNVLSQIEKNKKLKNTSNENTM